MSGVFCRDRRWHRRLYATEEIGGEGEAVDGVGGDHDGFAAALQAGGVHGIVPVALADLAQAVLADVLRLEVVIEDADDVIEYGVG